MNKYILQDDPFNVPTGGLKLIEEHFGNASNKYSNCSISYMEAPPRWREPYQNPEFDEFILLLKGKLMVHIDGEKVVVHRAQSLLIRKGARIRYSNPFDEPAKFWSICLPPFSLDNVHREA